MPQRTSPPLEISIRRRLCRRSTDTFCRLAGRSRRVDSSAASRRFEAPALPTNNCGGGPSAAPMAGQTIVWVAGTHRASSSALLGAHSADTPPTVPGRRPAGLHGQASAAADWEHPRPTAGSGARKRGRDPTARSGGWGPAAIRACGCPGAVERGTARAAAGPMARHPGGIGNRGARLAGYRRDVRRLGPGNWHGDEPAEDGRRNDAPPCAVRTVCGGRPGGGAGCQLTSLTLWGSRSRLRARWQMLRLRFGRYSCSWLLLCGRQEMSVRSSWPSRPLARPRRGGAPDRTGRRPGTDCCWGPSAPSEREPRGDYFCLARRGRGGDRTATGVAPFPIGEPRPGCRRGRAGSR